MSDPIRNLSRPRIMVISYRDHSLNLQAELSTTTHSSAICLQGHLLLYPDLSASNSLVVWDMDNQKMAGRLEGHNAIIRGAAIMGNLAVSTQVNRPPRLWNLETLQCTATLPDMPAIVSACCMEDRVLLGSSGTIRVWDVAASTPVPLPDLEGHTAAAVFCIKASASTVLSGSEDETVWLWDMRTGKCVRTMEGHTDIVISVDMDEQCRTAVSGSADKMARLWDLGSGHCIGTYEGHTKIVRDVVMHESGSSFLSYGNDNIVNHWAVGSTKAIMRADMTVSSSPPKAFFSRLFASKDLSSVTRCCVDRSNMLADFRVWR